MLPVDRAGRSPACSTSASASIRKRAAARQSRPSSRQARSIRSARTVRSLLARIDRAMQSGAAVLADRRSGQRGLFQDADDDGAASNKIALPALPEFGEKERLAMEKEVLGFYLSSHPLAEHEAVLRTFCTHTSAARQARAAHGSALGRHARRGEVFAHQESSRGQHQHQIRDVGLGRSGRHRALHHVAGAICRVRPTGEGRRDRSLCGPASIAVRAVMKSISS